MTQLPLFVAGLWLGAGAAAVAGASGTLVLLAASEFSAPAIFAALNAGPVTLLVRQALLARRRADGSFAWYPPGLADRLADRAGAGRHRGGGVAARRPGRAAGSAARDGRAGAGPHRQQAGAEPRAGRRGAGMIIPGVVAASWMVTTVDQRRAGAGAACPVRRQLATEPDLAALALPVWLTAALAGAAALTIFPGRRGLSALNMTIALSVRVLPGRPRRAARRGAAAVAADDGAGRLSIPWPGCSAGPS